MPIKIMNDGYENTERIDSAQNLDSDPGIDLVLPDDLFESDRNS